MTTDIYYALAFWQSVATEQKANPGVKSGQKLKEVTERGERLELFHKHLPPAYWYLELNCGVHNEEARYMVDCIETLSLSLPVLVRFPNLLL